MQGPHLVARKAPIAVKFEGGSENAAPIVAWIRSNGHKASWIEEYEVHEECISITWTNDDQHISSALHIKLRAGYWIVWEEGYYSVMSEEKFHTLYDDKEPFKDFVERHLGEDAQHTYVARELTVKALQMPTQKENEASKDLEERVRAIAQFIDAEGGEIFDFDVKELGVTYEGNNIRMEPGEWVVSDFRHNLHFLTHEDFRLFYKSAEEAS